ncbi:hypothetical protein [Burkholderia metallica]|uniref:hypothetical protein n=1 Tax=Burkholderia metallica TaxID=488729 RepID=UPI001CF1BD8E|nr:hypothetical protein [Burkholderia metallica]MCA8018066.1 hypothetical protein [Burkholderia metallica]
MKFFEKLLLAFVWGITAIGLTVLVAVNAHAQTFQVNNVTASGSNPKIDLTGSTASGTYFAGQGIYSVYPSVGYIAGDHQRAQLYQNFTPTQSATISETGILINATMNSGLALSWTPSTYYALGSYLDADGNVYLNTQAGTSASSGSGPSGTGNAITDGTAIWSFQCADQCNSKLPLFISATAGPQAGHVWASSVDLVLNPGWVGGFGTTFESDITNNSGSFCGGCQNFFATGFPGTNTVQAAYSAYDPSTTANSWVNAFQVAGVKGYSNAAFYDQTASGNYGLYLNGSYAIAPIEMDTNFAQIRMGGGITSFGGRWRIISNINGSNDGSLVLQHTTDNFSSNFTATLTANPDGSISLPPVTTSSLGSCTSVKEAVVSDGILNPTYRQAATGGGTSARKVFCDGGGAWVYD